MIHSILNTVYFSISCYFLQVEIISVNVDTGRPASINWDVLVKTDLQVVYLSGTTGR